MKTRQNCILILLLTFQWLVVSSGQDGNEDCPLICMNGSECIPGNAFFVGHPKDSQGNDLEIHAVKNITDYHCDCPEGFTGVACSIVYESCADGDDDHVCYHGGACIPGQKDDFGNDQYHCDCSSAVFDNGTVAQHYVGIYCEYKQETNCDDNDMFCVNNGVCSINPSNGEVACTCGDGFTGIHCQYRKQEVPSCDLQCQNEGSCQIGLPPSSDFKNDDTTDFQFCQCPAGVHGDLCEQDDGVQCGGNKCYHGSECAPSQGSLYCDCTAANVPSKHYAGRFCEYEATTYCSATQEYYCVNGGECVDQGKGIFVCDCPDDWSGPSCEFESANRDHVYENCTLNCYNGGDCRKGAKDMSAILGVGPELSHLVDVSSHSENFEHCVCPTGFTGLKCEHEYTECGNGEHMCLHGSKCTPPKDEQHPLWTCDCEEAFREDHKYAGEFCQHHHTTTCTTSDAENSIYQGAVSLTFCVNDGVCIEIKENGQSRPGCKCPDQYTGMHCELLIAGLPKHGSGLDPADAGGSAAIVFVCFVLSIILAALTAVIVFRLRAKVKRRNEERIETSHFDEDASKSPIIEEVDFHDSIGAMEDIELL